jgi:hypothetical protein
MRSLDLVGTANPNLSQSLPVARSSRSEDPSTGSQVLIDHEAATHQGQRAISSGAEIRFQEVQS